MGGARFHTTSEASKRDSGLHIDCHAELYSNLDTIKGERTGGMIANGEK